MDGAEIIDPEDWYIAELEDQLKAMARNGQRDTPEYESLQDRMLALKELQQSEPESL